MTKPTKHIELEERLAGVLMAYLGHGDYDGSDFIEASRAAIAECFRWRPIETAPKDGTCILGCIMPSADAYDMVLAFWHKESWRDSTDGGPIEPTHWLPLPPPPTGDDA